jgi:TetR/AcrR family transcriptional repressor of nem operon
MSTKAERTKAFIIEKTSPVFNQKGVVGTSLSDITEATGLTKGAIYGNFADKDEVALAAFEYNVDKVFSGIYEAMSHEVTAVGKLKAVTGFYRKYFAADKYKYGCPMANTATECDDTHPALQAKVKGRYFKWGKGIEIIINEGIANGEFKHDVDVKTFANLMIVTIQGSIVVSKVTADESFVAAPMDFLDSVIESYRLK